MANGIVISEPEFSAVGVSLPDGCSRRCGVVGRGKNRPVFDEQARQQSTVSCAGDGVVGFGMHRLDGDRYDLA